MSFLDYHNVSVSHTVQLSKTCTPKLIATFVSIELWILVDGPLGTLMSNVVHFKGLAAFVSQMLLQVDHFANHSLCVVSMVDAGNLGCKLCYPLRGPLIPLPVELQSISGYCA